MKSIILKRGQLCWQAEFLVDGQPDHQLELWAGSNVVPLPFRNFHDSGEVALWVARNNPRYSVEVAS